MLASLMLALSVSSPPTTPELARDFAEELRAVEFAALGEELLIVAPSGAYELSGEGEDAFGVHEDGQSLGDGVWLLPEGTVLLSSDGTPLRVLEWDVVAFRASDLPGGQTSCEVTCGEGYYACCYIDGLFNVRCRCLTTDEIEPGALGCQSGGVGSTSCSISRPAR